MRDLASPLVTAGPSSAAPAPAPSADAEYGWAGEGAGAEPMQAPDMQQLSAMMRGQ